MSKAKYLENASGACFFSGFMLSKLQYLPFPIIAAILRFVSLGIYLIGYIMWFIACLLQPEYKRKGAKWYGFAMLKDQLLFSSLIGFIATIISLIAIPIPFLFPAAAWLYTLGNALWAIGEYHKLHNPPEEDKQFSYKKQNAYFKYSVTMTLISLVTAIASSLIIALPLATIPITVFSACICVGLGAFAFENWLEATFGEHKTGSNSKNHIKTTTNEAPPPENIPKPESELKPDPKSESEPESEPEPEPAPYHGKSLFPSEISLKCKTEIKNNPPSDLLNNADSGLMTYSTL
jgi:hypothetical protein